MVPSAHQTDNIANNYLSNRRIIYMQPSVHQTDNIANNYMSYTRIIYMVPSAHQNISLSTRIINMQPSLQINYLRIITPYILHIIIIGMSK